MGWTYSHEDTRYTSRKDLVIDQLEWEDARRKDQVLYASVKGSTVYAAVKQIDKDCGAVQVWGVVVLTHVRNADYCNFGVKIIDENMGPCESDAPKKLIHMLSPTKNEYAMDWRGRCLLHHERRKTLMSFPYGTIIQVADKELEVFTYRGRKVFKYRNEWKQMPASRIIHSGFTAISQPASKVNLV